MKAFEWNLRQKDLKLASNDNYFTGELIVTEFKLFTSN